MGPKVPVDVVIEAEPDGAMVTILGYDSLMDLLNKQLHTTHPCRCIYHTT